MKKNRIDFTRSVKQVLFKNVNGQCSVPRCKNTTMGPFNNSGGSVNLGIACHIHSAAEDGPRGRGGHDDNFIGSEKNGLWCCAQHAALIDKKDGNDYPAEVLFLWKDLAEARVKKLLVDTPSPLGWIESAEFLLFPVSALLPRVDLSRYTLLTGKNATGKTSLLEIMASISDSSYANRFLANSEHGETNTIAKICYSTVDTLNKEIELKIKGQRIFRRVNNTSCLLPPGDIEIMFLPDNFKKLKEEDDLDFLMRVLKVDKSSLYELIELGASIIMRGEISLEHSTVEDENEGMKLLKENDEPYIELFFKQWGSNSSIVFNGLSNNEQSCLILELFLLKAREICKERLTLLLLDGITNILDEKNFYTLLDALQKENFQSIVCIPDWRHAVLIDHSGDPLSLKRLDCLHGWKLRILEKSF